MNIEAYANPQSTHRNASDIDIQYDYTNVKSPSATFTVYLQSQAFLLLAHPHSCPCLQAHLNETNRSSISSIVS